jgi:hypothetical protein
MDLPATSSHIEQHDSVHDEFVAVLLCQALKTRHRPTLVARPLKGTQTPGIVHMGGTSLQEAADVSSTATSLGIASIWTATAELPSVIAMCNVICQSQLALSIMQQYAAMLNRLLDTSKPDKKNLPVQRFNLYSVLRVHSQRSTTYLFTRQRGCSVCTSPVPAFARLSSCERPSDGSSRGRAMLKKWKFDTR